MLHQSKLFDQLGSLFFLHTKLHHQCLYMIYSHFHAKRTALYINAKRYKCHDCNKTFYEDLPHIHSKRNMTIWLENWIGKQAVKRTFTSISEDVGCTKVTVKSVFNDYINALEAKVRFETLLWMGIDEIHLIKP